MHKWILIGLTLISTIGTIAVIKFGLNPRPIPIIKASNFEEPSKFSRYIYRQLYPKLKLSKIIAFGTDEVYPYDDELIESLVRMLSTEMGKTLHVFSDRDFKSYNQDMSNLRFTKVDSANIEQVSKEIKQDTESAFLNILILKNKDVLHKFKESFVNKLEFGVQKEVLSFSIWSLDGIDSSQELKPCENTNDFYPWLECLKLNKARSIEISKKADKTKTTGILERVSEKDFFIFIKNR